MVVTRFSIPCGSGKVFKSVKKELQAISSTAYSCEEIVAACFAIAIRKQI
jgi:hypothetical protein